MQDQYNDIKRLINTTLQEAQSRTADAYFRFLAVWRDYKELWVNDNVSSENQ